MYCRHSSQRQQGAALIVALLVFAVAAALLVGLQREFTLHMQRGSNYFAMEQGWSYLLGADPGPGHIEFEVHPGEDTPSPGGRVEPRPYGSGLPPAGCDCLVLISMSSGFTLSQS